MTVRIGELFAGYGGLGEGVRRVFGGEIAWFSEFDPAPSKILAHHWPDIPNFGDITKIDWSTVPPVDILTGGFPCQDVSLAGARAGLKDGTRSGLWSEFARAIAHLKPRMVVIENVRGLLSAAAGGSVEPDPWGVGDGATRPVINALGAVLGDLANLGYDARWCGIRAADAGAPHGRYRVFIVATQNPDLAAGGERRQPAPGQTEGGRSRADASGRGGAPAADSSSDEPERWGGDRNVGSEESPREGDREERERIRDTTRHSGAEDGTVPDTGSQRGHEGDDVAGQRGEGADRAGVVDERGTRSGGTEWGIYSPAIQRWERVLGRPAPAPTNPDGKNGSHRLSARFVEFLMGLPEGHVTDPAIGLTRNEQLKALGNGVVPAQAALALRLLTERR